METMELTIRLPKPHTKQGAFLNSRAKRKAIVAGRRSGKTTGTGILAVEKLLAGRRILQAAPTADQTDRFWEVCTNALDELIRSKIVYKNETRRILEFKAKRFKAEPRVIRQGDIEIEVPEYPRIRTKTAWDEDTMRGDYADVLILEEYSYMSASAWNKVGAPMLLDNDGDAVFIFTPNRRNHAHALHARALGDTTGRWGAWHFTSHDNPYLSKAALEEITADLTESAYKQEILAEFLEGEGAVFRNIKACCVLQPSTPAEHEGHEIVAGVDWGKVNDYTAISVGCRTCQREVELDRFHGVAYRLARQRLAALADRWHVYDVLAESNAMGEPIIEEMQFSGLPVRGFATTAGSKPPLIENLALCLEREEVRFLDDPIGVAELEAYEMKTSANTGRPTYSAPEGLHDDTVMARALMVRAMQLGGPMMTLL
jgi:hypothetical protein